MYILIFFLNQRCDKELKYRHFKSWKIPLCSFMNNRKILHISIFLTFIACNTDNKNYIWKSMEVTVSAYNSTAAQTDGQPNLAAWGDTLAPGMKAIAVSRDLVGLGLNHNTQVKIEGLKGIYLVKDKMHQRWRKKIDLYMGTNIDRKSVV